MKNERFVAFFDILGFKELVSYTSIDDLRNRIEAMIGKIDRITKMSKLTFDEKNNIEYIIFSDSIVFYSKDLSEESFKNICVTSSIFMFISILDFMPVRGAISHGEFYIDKVKNIFFGKALVSAYEAEGKQKWSGASICKETVNFVFRNYKNGIEWLKKGRYIFEYDVPMLLVNEERVFSDNGKEIQGYKYTKGSDKYYVINWCILNSILEEIDSEYKIIETDFQKYFLSAESSRIKKLGEATTYEKFYDEIDSGIRFKIANTKEFFIYVLKQGIEIEVEKGAGVQPH